ncbi:sodium/calcium exchanger 1-like [Diretmus argenteus]
MGLHSPSSMGLHSSSSMGLHSPSSMGLHSPSSMGLHSPSSMGLHSPSSMGLHSPSSMGLHSPSSMGLHSPSSSHRAMCHHGFRVAEEVQTIWHSTVDKLIKKTNLALVVGSSSWREQFVSAVTVSAGDDDEEESGEERLPSCFDYIMHFLTVFWKVLFAFVPPTEYWNGWACFIVSISLIGILTAVTGDLASHFGCTVGLKDSVTAVVFVALGTSVPDTFASKVAAIQDQYADASIGNVTGSNAVNVFLGIGVAWTIAAIAWRSQGKPFKVDPGSLAFSVTLYTILALVCVTALLYRRRASVAGGELGGPRTCKIVTSLLFVSLWLIYIMLASLEAYCHIPGF